MLPQGLELTIERHLVSAALLVLVLGLTSACTSTALTVASSSFATSVETATKAHEAQLVKVAGARHERILAEIAAQRIDLSISDACLELLKAYSVEAERNCVVQRHNGDPIDPNPIQTDKLVALSGALRSYAQALATVGADPTEDRKAFAAAVLGLGGAIGKLDEQIARISGSSVGTEKIDAVAGMIAEAVGLYLEYSRSQFLKEAIPVGEPFVFEATKILEQSSANARTALLSTQARNDLNAKMRELSKLVTKRAGAKKIKAAQAAVFEAHKAFVTASGVEELFAQVRAAHTAMAQAANAGLSEADLLPMIERLVELAGKVDATTKVILN